MKVISVMNGKKSIVLIPENEVEEAMLKSIGNGAEVRLIIPGSNTQILDTTISKGLLIQEVTTKKENTEIINNEQNGKN